MHINCSALEMENEFQTLNRLKKIAMWVSFTFLLLFGTCQLGTHPRIGCFAESNFDLSDESRYPKWFNIPQGYERKDLSVRIYYYAQPFGETNFRTVLIGPPPENRILQKKFGTSEWHPVTKAKIDAGLDHYPSYHIVRVDGMAELVEHRKMEPIFYISDDAELKKAIQ